MLEKCPHCGADVLFVGTVCPRCQIDRANPDPEKVASLHKLPTAVKEARWRARLVNSGVICMALFAIGAWMLWSAYSFTRVAASAPARVLVDSLRKTGTARVRYHFSYEFVVDGRRYTGVGEDPVSPPLMSTRHVIYYDKFDPWRNRWLMPNPWPGWVLAISGLLGTAATCYPWHRRMKQQGSSLA